MGLFDFFGEVLALPLRVTASTIKTTVKVTGHVVTGQLDEVKQDVGEAVDETIEAVEKAKDTL